MSYNLTDALVVTEEQEALGKTARELAEKHAPLTRLRALRDAGDARGYDQALWAQLIELGFTALPFPEDQGGYGLGLPEVTAVMEGLGRTLAASPYLSLLMSGHILAAARDTRWLPRVLSGEAIVAVASSATGDSFRIEDWPGGDLRLTGRAVGVLDAGVADAFIVRAKTGALYMVPKGNGTVSNLRRLDGRCAGDLTLEHASFQYLNASDAALEQALDYGRVALAAEMLGGMTAVFETTLEYLKTRVQFDKPIGAFQALQHRAVDCLIQLELTRSTVMAAARATPEELPELASLAKARASEAFQLVVDEAVQMHGGIGVTDECDVGFFLKRARVAGHTLGSARFHRDRWARLRGY